MSKVETKLFLKKQLILDDTYNSILASIENYINELSFKLIDFIKKNMIDEFLSLSEKSLLGNIDEKTYFACEHAFKMYERALNIYKLNCDKVTSEKKCTILKGLESVLISQVSNFLEDADFNGENPVLLEKRNIIQNEIFEFEDKFNKYIRRYFEYNFPELKNKIADLFLEENKSIQLDKIKDLIIEDLDNKFVGLVYDDFLKLKNKCVLNLNDLSNRKITTKFFEIIKLEYEILSSIIKIQVVPLEELSTGESEENIVISEILSVLREAYQYMSKNVNDLMAALSESDKCIEQVKEIELEDYKNSTKLFIENKFCDDDFGYQNFVTVYDENLNSFYKGLFDEIIFFTKQAAKEELTQLKNYYREKAFDINKMASELVKGFKVLIYYFSEKKDMLALNSEFEIVKGINETMEIKVESMEESSIDFSKNIVDILYEFNNIDVETSDAEDGILIEELKKLWVQNYCIYKKDILSKTFNSLDKSEPFMKISSKYNKLIENKKNKVEKYIISYKRNNVLYEIVTFEEIEKYSAKKLKESQSLEVIKYVKIFYKVVIYVNKILERHNIIRIKPKPHEMFNSQEHEALLAEKNDEFSKGEIIKVTNNGFRENEIVYIRANVIAAR